MIDLYEIERRTARIGADFLFVSLLLSAIKAIQGNGRTVKRYAVFGLGGCVLCLALSFVTFVVQSKGGLSRLRLRT